MRKDIIEKFLKTEIAEFIFPRVCPVCGDILTEKDFAHALCQRSSFHHNGKNISIIEYAGSFEKDNEANAVADCVVVNPYICRYCYEKLKFVREPRCFRCGRQLDNDDDEFCFRCSSEIHEYEQGMSLLVHDDNAKKMLYDLKYSNLRDNADFLGLETALRLGRRIAELQPDAVIPIPLHKKRKRDRGFNQSELLSLKILKNIEILCGTSLHFDNEILVRHHNTKPQKELKEEKRKMNVKDSFSLTKECAYKRVLLVDDIYTTGSTIDECARVLKNGGVSEVYFLTMSIV